MDRKNCYTPFPVLHRSDLILFSHSDYDRRQLTLIGLSTELYWCWLYWWARTNSSGQHWNDTKQDKVLVEMSYMQWCKNMHSIFMFPVKTGNNYVTGTEPMSRVGPFARLSVGRSVASSSANMMWFTSTKGGKPEPWLADSKKMGALQKHLRHS